AAEQDGCSEDRQRGDEQNADLHQAAEQFAEDKFVIAQISHQEQNKGAAILLLGDSGGGQERREENDEGELEKGEELEEENAEMRDVAESNRLAPTEERLPERDSGDEEKSQVEGAQKIMPRVAGNRQGFAVKDRAEHGPRRVL